MNSILDNYKACDTHKCDNLNTITFFNDSTRDINLIHVNIRSIYKNFDQFLVFLESTKISFDIIVMSETHTVYNIEDFNLHGYKMLFNDGTLNRCDGCAVYVKQEYYLKNQLIVENNLKIIKVTITKNNQTVDVLATYKGFALTKEEFIESLNTILQRLTIDRTLMQILVGDMNINLLDTNASTTIEYLTMLQGYGFFSTINKSTRKSDHTETCLDHCFVRCKNNLFEKINAVILEHSLTDHDPILLNIPLETNIKVNEIQKKTYDIINYEKLNKLMEEAAWDDILEHWDADLCTNIFVNRLKGMIVGSTKTICLKSKNRRLKPWITGGLLTSIRNRDRLKKDCTLNRNNIDLLNTYREFRKMLDKLIKKTKYEYYKLLAQKNANDPKKIWEVIKEATNDQMCKTEIKSVVNCNNIEITDKKIIANEFNSYFANIGKNLANRTVQVGNIENPGEESRLVDSFFFNPISKSEIIKQINSLKNGVKGGEDCISSNIIKKYKDKLIKPLLHIINVVFSTGVFPEILKSATIIPLHKQGDKKLLNNYRPIALTSTIGKIIEKCFRLKLLMFIKKNKLLNERQFAFREDSSTENALCDVTENILRRLDKGEKVIGIFLDLRKAFDTVSHPIMLKRLEHIGVRGIPNNLVRSYLNNRKQSVVIPGSRSDMVQVGFGVPQGTVLSPLLFNIYINGIFSSIDVIEGTIFCFADDSGVIISGKDWQSAKRTAEMAIHKIKKWLDISLLSLNVEKNKFMAFSFSPRSLPDFQDLRMHNSNCGLGDQCSCDNYIERKVSLKYLGIYIDENFTWKEHLEYITGKIRKLIHKFYELRNILTLNTLKIVYYAVVESVINYGIVVWGNAGSTIMTKLQIAQKWIIKVMLCKNSRYPTELVYKDSQLLSPNQLHIKSIIRLMLKNSRYKENIKHGINTRNVAQNNVLLQNPKHSLCQKHIYCVGPKVFNALPPKLRTEKYQKIKNEINKWIVESNFTINYIT